jgi:hypothetical protein
MPPRVRAHMSVCIPFFTERDDSARGRRAGAQRTLCPMRPMTRACVGRALVVRRPCFWGNAVSMPMPAGGGRVFRTLHEHRGACEEVPTGGHPHIPPLPLAYPQGGTLSNAY